MKTKTVLMALALTLAPALAVAEGCSFGKHQQAMSCAAGTTYDADTNSCVPTTS